MFLFTIFVMCHIVFKAIPLNAAIFACLCILYVRICINVYDKILYEIFYSERGRKETV